MKLNKIISVLAVLIIFGSFSYAFQINYDDQSYDYTGPEVTLVVENTYFKPQEDQMPPVIIDDRTLVPAREVMEMLGGTVNWDAESKTVIISIDNRQIELTINNNIAIIDGEPITLDVPAKIINNKTMVPVRFISENAGFEVAWESEDNTVIISRPAELIPVVDTLEAQNSESIIIEPKGATIETNISTEIPLAVQFYNERFSESFGTDKGRTVTAQLLDLISSNNVGNMENSILVEFEDEKGVKTSASNFAQIAGIKSDILKMFYGRYSISGEYNEAGYLNKVLVKRTSTK